MKAVLEAVESHNQKTKSQIRIVGFWTENLRIARMDVSVAGKVIRGAYQEVFPRETS